MFALSVILSFVIPPVYRSSATILIEQQEIPQELVPSAVTSYAVERIQRISKRVMTRENMTRIIEKYDLFPKERQSGDLGEVIIRMRKGIQVEMIGADVIDPKTGAAVRPTIAFELSFSANTPETAHTVAKELVSLFLNENHRISTEKAEGATTFLGDEANKLSERISELEAKLAVYKERNTGRLPELIGLNMQQLEHTQKELEDVQRQIYSLDERKLLLHGQLSQVEPYAGQSSPGGRLRMAQTEYLSAMAKYSPDHPDVVRARREVEALKKEAGIQDVRSTIEAEYKKVRAELDAAREKYADDHPDIIRLKNSLAMLETKLKAAPASDQVGFALKPDNPAYIALQTQLDTVNLNLKTTKEQLARARAKSSEYEGRITQTPRVEQEGLALKREYDNAVQKFREIREKQLRADVSKSLEEGNLGERFSLIDPPQLPDSPHSPNRRAFLLLGIMFGLGSGIGYATIIEAMDRAIRGSRTVRAVTGMPPLAVIPNIAAAGNVLPGSVMHPEGAS